MLATVIVTTTSIVFVLAIIAFVITMIYFYIKDKATDKRMAETNTYMRKKKNALSKVHYDHERKALCCPHSLSSELL